MFIFYAVILALVPISLIFIGVLWRYRIPKNINLTYGYRTPRSILSEDTWEFAHRYSGKISLRAGIISFVVTAVLTAVLYAMQMDIEFITNYVLVMVFVQLAPFIIMIVFTEKALKATFDEQGKKMR